MTTLPRRRSPEDAIHPSLRGEQIEPNLPVDLSNAEFRGYRTRNRSIVLHHKSYLLIGTTVGFGLDAYLHDITGNVTLPNGRRFPVEEFSYSVDCAARYDQRTMVHDFTITLRTDLLDIPPGIGSLNIQIDVNIHGAPFRGVVKRQAMFIRRFRPSG